MIKFVLLTYFIFLSLVNRISFFTSSDFSNLKRILCSSLLYFYDGNNSFSFRIPPILINLIKIKKSNIDFVKFLFKRDRNKFKDVEDIFPYFIYK